MELLVATLVRMTRNNSEDATIRVRMIVDTVRNAPGVSNARFYQSRESETYYFLLSTWEDESFWKRGQERYNPRDLLLTSTHDLLTSPPEQWLLNYLWGYSRPAAQPMVAAAHITTVRPDQAEQVQRAWIEHLRRQAAAPTLAFAFLARGRNEEAIPPLPSAGNGQNARNGTFVNLLSWPGEAQRKDFYSDSHYRTFQTFLNTMGITRTLALEPL